MPLKLSSGGPVEYGKHRESICLTSDQAMCIYKKVKDGIVNVETIKQEDRLDKDYEIEEGNPY